MQETAHSPSDAALYARSRRPPSAQVVVTRSPELVATPHGRRASEPSRRDLQPRPASPSVRRTVSHPNSSAPGRGGELSDRRRRSRSRSTSPHRDAHRHRSPNSYPQSRSRSRSPHRASPPAALVHTSRRSDSARSGLGAAIALPPCPHCERLYQHLRREHGASREAIMHLVSQWFQ